MHTIMLPVRGDGKGRNVLAHATVLLVMGAYHECYEREPIFGGNSQVVVAEAELPVVLVH